MTTTLPKIATPAVGIHEDVPFSDYRLWPCVNKSILDWIQDWSPAHCKYHQENPEPETPALRIGRAFHTLVLEKDRYEEEFAICPKMDKRTNAGKASWTAFLETNGSKTVLPEDEDALVHSMRNATLDCEVARQFIGSEGRNEISIVWEDSETGLLCKARIDMWRPTWAAIGDLKSSGCAAPDEFMRSMATYGYHRQAAFYLDGARSVGMKVDCFALVVAEKEPPFGVATYQVDEHAIEIGRSQIRRLLRTYAQCKETGQWWGYAGEFPLITVPRYETIKAMQNF